MNTTEQMPVLGRCKESSCDYALWSAPEDIRSAATLNDVIPGAAFRMSDRSNLLARCPHKHKVFRLYQVEGEYDPDVKCDGRCEGARGRKCVCACGGMNHGRGHAGTVENVSKPHVATCVRGMSYLPQAAVDANRDDKAQTELDALEDSEYADYERERTPQEALFGEVGDTIRGYAKVTHKQDVSDATMYLFRANVEGSYGTIKWFSPSYANPDFEKGNELTFKAKVKRHETQKYGNTTLVTYFEQTGA